MVAILSEKSKKENTEVSYRPLLRLQEERFVQGVCYFINKISIFI
jgi:hypothetical protein